MASSAEPPALMPAAKPVNLIPVGLKEAALDSPSFRASVIHFSEQAETVEKWLESYAKSISKLSHDVSALETSVNKFTSSTMPPEGLSEAIIDPDYTVLVAKRYAEFMQVLWKNASSLKRIDSTLGDPIRHFLSNEVKTFRDVRKHMEQSQRTYDSLYARYAAQKKTSEPSSLREDAFQLHEARKTYVKAAMDFSIAAPQLRLALDKTLVTLFSSHAHTLRTSRDNNHNLIAKWSSDIERVHGWSREMENSERVFNNELVTARKAIEESAEFAARPSRDLDDYSATPVSKADRKLPTPRPEKQAWMSLKILVGKPQRTSWVRRWFYVKNGVFGWLVQSSGDVLESEKIGLLLCSVRAAAQEERRFCFEVKTNNSTIVVQADSLVDMNDWFKTFELAKQKVLAEPSNPVLSGSGKLVDPAFEISAPSAPEFAANNSDIGLVTTEDIPDRTNTGESSLRAVEAVANRRSSMMEREPESSREKIMSKLKASSSSNPPPSISSGIGGLIAASHASMALAAGTSVVPTSSDTRIPSLSVAKQPTSPVKLVAPHPLAPATFINPPVPTNLSGTAIFVAGERGMDAFKTAKRERVSSAVLANLWGSANWASSAGIDNTEQIPDPSQLARIATNPQPVANEQSPDPPGQIEEEKTEPTNYPKQLTYQDAQFRLLFADADPTEKVVLVFRCNWSAADHQDFPGRAYVTEKSIHFYSNHLGLVLVSGFRLTSILEVTAAPGRDCDFLFLHLKNAMVDYTRVTVKVFLEPLRVLQRRLNFLIDNASATDPLKLEKILPRLIKMENEKDRGPASNGSWEELDTPVDALAKNGFNANEKDVRPKIQLDNGLDLNNKNVVDGPKFKLPSKPVEYVPRGMSKPAVEKIFDISSRALFHVMFGDKSAVWQLLYKERRAQHIVQSPWALSSDQAHKRRAFEYRIEYIDILRRNRVADITDTQMIDVCNDHLCYVVTDRKTAWHLPWSSRFALVSKIVITHVSKYKSKLAIYTEVDWSASRPLALSGLIERPALIDLETDALDLTDLISDQVRKLGPAARTKRAVQIFGGIGQVTTAMEFNPSDTSAALSDSKRPIVQRSLTRLFFYAVWSFTESLLTQLLYWFLDATRWSWNTAKANRLVIVALVLSLLANLVFTSQDFNVWWQDRRAYEYMSKLGVGQNMHITRSITLDDLALATSSAVSLQDNLCYSTFEATLDPATPSPFATRLQRTRDQLGMYRHDLMVAIRVVNSIEKEVLQVAYEDWIMLELGKCAKFEKFAGGNLNETEKNRVEGLKGRVGEFCEDCRGAKKALELGG